MSNIISQIDFYLHNPKEEEEINNFIDRYINYDFSVDEKSKFIDFLNNVNVSKSKYKYVNNLYEYQQLIKNVSNILKKEYIDINDLAYFDELFKNEKYLLFLNYDIKTLRRLEDQLYRKLKQNNGINNYLVYYLDNNIKISIAILVCLAIDFYRINHHPAQTVTFYQNIQEQILKNNKDINININYNLFKVSDKDNLVYNIKLIAFIYRECTYFKILYNNNEFLYDVNLMKIAMNYDVKKIINDFYLEHVALINGYNLTKELIDKLTLKKSEKVNDVISNLVFNINDSYYNIVNGVRTNNTRDKVYNELYEIVKNDVINDKKINDENIKRLNENKYKQEMNGLVYDDYSLNKLEIKRIILVILLEYTKGKTYSRFYQDVLKDVVSLKISDVVDKYMKKEYRNSLQKLYLEINDNTNYTDLEIKKSILKVPVHYPYIDKIKYLSLNEDIIKISS